MSDVTDHELLQKLRRRVVRERALYRRIARSADGLARERAFSEANVCSLVIAWIDALLRGSK